MGSTLRLVHQLLCLPRWAALRVALLPLAVLATGCGEPESSPVFSRLERLAFQAEGSCVLFADTNAPIDCSGERPIFIDRFEVTRAEWSRWEASRDAEAEGSQARSFWSDLSPTYPATGMNLAEAEAFAADQAMRLPTAREWIRAAAGSRAQRWPWGPSPARSVANTLDLGLGRLAPVGTFESGSTSLGVHDLLGNASEWVTDWIPPVGEEDLADDRVWALGGSFQSHGRETYWPGLEEQAEFNAELMDPEDRGDDVGLRLFADAEIFLREVSSEWGESPEVHARLVRIGASWGRSAVPLLRRLSAEEGAAPGLAALLEGALRGVTP